MLVAKDKIKTNIGEYFLYMFQIEDLIRACNLKTTIIESSLVSQYKTDDKTITEIKEWYFGLADLMEEEKLQTVGHLSIINNKITEVFDFHLYLLTRSDRIKYQESFKEIAPLLEELKAKQKQVLNDVETIINTIYGVYILKLKKQEVSKETMESTSKLSKFMSVLSKMFADYETGKLKID